MFLWVDLIFVVTRLEKLNSRRNCGRWLSVTVQLKHVILHSIMPFWGQSYYGVESTDEKYDFRHPVELDRFATEFLGIWYLWFLCWIEG